MVGLCAAAVAHRTFTTHGGIFPFRARDNITVSIGKNDGPHNVSSALKSPCLGVAELSLNLCFLSQRIQGAKRDFSDAHYMVSGSQAAIDMKILL